MSYSSMSCRDATSCVSNRQAMHQRMTWPHHSAMSVASSGRAVKAFSTSARAAAAAF